MTQTLGSKQSSLVLSTAVSPGVLGYVADDGSEFVCLRSRNAVDQDGGNLDVAEIAREQPNYVTPMRFTESVSRNYVQLDRIVFGLHELILLHRIILEKMWSERTLNPAPVRQPYPLQFAAHHFVQKERWVPGHCTRRKRTNIPDAISNHRHAVGVQFCHEYRSLAPARLGLDQHVSPVNLKNPGR